MSSDRVVQLLDRRKSDGTPYYAREDVLHFLPLVLLITAPKSLATLPPHLDKIMVDFSGKLGIAPGAGPEVIQKAIDAYYARKPVNPALAADFRDVLQVDVNRGADALDLAPAAAALHSFNQTRHVPIPQRGSLWGDDGGDSQKKK
jgi:hypothetical protein